MIESIKQFYFNWRMGPEEKLSHVKNRVLVLSFHKNQPVMVAGGPYRDVKPGFIGVRLEANVDKPHHVDFAIRDFGVPAQSVAEDKVLEILDYAEANPKVYIGCLGGTGRTGLVIALLIKVMQAAKQLNPTLDPIQLTRRYYKPGAIETDEQEEFVRKFDAKTCWELYKHDR